MDAVRVNPEPAGGVRVTWTSNVDSQVRSLAGDQLRPGDVVLAVDGVRVNSTLDLWTAYRRNREKPSAPVQIRRASGQTVTIQVRNPAQRQGAAAQR